MKSYLFAQSTSDEPTISIVAINFYIDDIKISDNSKYGCEIAFKDDYKNIVEDKKDKNSNYIILKSNSSKIYIDHIKCQTHKIPLIYGKSRYKIFDDYGFFAHSNVINYVGEINVFFYPEKFKILDVFNFGNLSNDKGDIKIEIKDNIIDFLGFVNSRFINIKGINIAKSILSKSPKIKPNEKPNIVTQDDLKPKETSVNNELFLKEKFNKNVDVIQNKQPQIIPIETIKNSYKIDNHPYNISPYIDIYSSFQNPYYSIDSQNNHNSSLYTETQDLIVESPH